MIVPPAAPNKERLDLALVRLGLADSREQAKRLILAGEVKVGTEIWDKPSAVPPHGGEISVKERPRFVSRGGLKLEAALEHFGIPVEGKCCFDAGASTGGFTDCLLQTGARHVYAFDVGTNQLAWKIRSDPRVTAREQFNVRHMRPEDVGEAVDLVVLGLSFISLTKILPACWKILAPGADVVCLIKPQFELERHEVGKGGIVKDPALRDKAVAKIKEFIESTLPARWCGVMGSPVQGADGNQEFLAWLKNR